ncbi:MAG: anti-anti-sigma factor [Alteromonadaceae bacterium]|nr:MAG: anti-anti-sigma factor [Alteromonadaceae bacterium]
MAITIAKNNEGVAIVLDDRFDFGSVGDFRKSYESLESIARRTVAIDFKNTRYIDSSALGMLINAKTYCAKQDAKVKLINTNEQIRKILTISRFEKKFDIS